VTQPDDPTGPDQEQAPAAEHAPAPAPGPDPRQNIWRPPPPGTPPAGPPGQYPPGQYPPGQYPPGGPGKPNRFSKGGIFGGIGAALVLLLLAAGLGVGLLSMATSWGALSTLATVLSSVFGFLPLIAGIVLLAAGKTPGRRGLGLGLMIGWALWLVVGAGACVALLVALSSGSGG